MMECFILGGGCDIKKDVNINIYVTGSIPNSCATSTTARRTQTMRKCGIYKETGLDRRDRTRNVRIATAYCTYQGGIEDLVTWVSII